MVYGLFIYTIFKAKKKYVKATFYLEKNKRNSDFVEIIFKKLGILINSVLSSTRVP